MDFDERTAALIQKARTIDGALPLEIKGRSKSLAEAILHRLNDPPDSTWLTYYDDSADPQVIPMSEFLGRVGEYANWLKSEAGVVSGSRVATLSINHPDTLAVYCAIWLIGCAVVPINAGEDDARVGYVIANSEANAIAVWHKFTDRAAAIPETLELPMLVLGSRSSEIHFAPRLLESMAAGGPESEALIVYTSGTTGAPKGVVLDQSNIIADTYALADWHKFGPTDRAMSVLPIHHVNGIVVTFLTSLITGGSLTMHQRFRPTTFWRALAESRSTWVSVVPTVLAFLCEANEDIAEFDLTAFRHVICGAGPLTVEVVKRWEDRFGFRVVHGYGLSETTCYSCFLPIDLELDQHRSWLRDHGFPSIGVPLPINDMAIHDSNGQSLAAGIRGEIVIRGTNVMRCYYRRPDVNAETFKHGWFRSGDEGFFLKDELGRSFYFITGRLKELIIRGGVNISPFDIDEVLNAIAGVRAAMAVGFENDVYGEEIGAFVQLADRSNVTAEAIITECRKSLSFAKCPKVVVFGDEFPVTSTGKYQRNRLKPLFSEWKSVQFRER